MNGSDIAYYMTAVFSTLNTAVNPCVIISFQAKVRREIRILLTPGMARSSSVAWKTTVLPAYSSFNS
ncbi:unnamed protein product [Heligmosomoides polygyrus]|uniref:G_PROTEIN_RECEP_F1_2 domain-containing protein n=1 Tax=Heligmosomoides polygyrus TaxID=6339 RepID=A0A183FCC9_HELPZ|nr:unnamed protein product [Heligmosomoides polygyrus]